MMRGRMHKRRAMANPLLFAPGSWTGVFVWPLIRNFTFRGKCLRFLGFPFLGLSEPKWVANVTVLREIVRWGKQVKVLEAPSHFRTDFMIFLTSEGRTVPSTSNSAFLVVLQWLMAAGSTLIPDPDGPAITMRPPINGQSA